jgi:deoxyribose-phosphate aldolase
MKSFITALIAPIFVALAMAATNDPHVELKAIVVSYPKGTPNSEMEELKTAIAEVVS